MAPLVTRFAPLLSAAGTVPDCPAVAVWAGIAAIWGASVTSSETGLVVPFGSLSDAAQRPGGVLAGTSRCAVCAPPRLNPITWRSALWPGRTAQGTVEITYG